MAILKVYSTPLFTSFSMLLSDDTLSGRSNRSKWAVGRGLALHRILGVRALAHARV